MPDKGLRVIESIRETYRPQNPHLQRALRFDYFNAMLTKAIKRVESLPSDNMKYYFCTNG